MLRELRTRAHPLRKTGMHVSDTQFQDRGGRVDRCHDSPRLRGIAPGDVWGGMRTLATGHGAARRLPRPRRWAGVGLPCLGQLGTPETMAIRGVRVCLPHRCRHACGWRRRGALHQKSGQHADPSVTKIFWPHFEGFSRPERPIYTTKNPMKERLLVQSHGGGRRPTRGACG